MDKAEIVLEAKSVSKLYGRNKGEAVRLMEAGGDKEGVYRKTGVTVALWDLNFQVKRGEIFVVIGLSLSLIHICRGGGSGYRKLDRQRRLL